MDYNYNDYEYLESRLVDLGLPKAPTSQVVFNNGLGSSGLGSRGKKGMVTFSYEPPRESWLPMISKDPKYVSKKRWNNLIALLKQTQRQKGMLRDVDVYIKNLMDCMEEYTSVENQIDLIDSLPQFEYDSENDFDDLFGKSYIITENCINLLEKVLFIVGQNKASGNAINLLNKKIEKVVEKVEKELFSQDVPLGY